MIVRLEIENIPPANHPAKRKPYPDPKASQETAKL